MTTRCTTIIRAAAFLVVVLALWAMPSGARAQADIKCACDHYTIQIDPALTCKITICYQLSPKGPTFCNTYGPGDELTIPCPVYEASVELCNGSIVIVNNNPVISRCTEIFHITRDCCARACRGTDEKGCPLIKITAAGCVNDLCP